MMRALLAEEERNLQEKKEFERYIDYGILGLMAFQGGMILNPGLGQWVASSARAQFLMPPLAMA